MKSHLPSLAFAALAIVAPSASAQPHDLEPAASCQVVTLDTCEVLPPFAARVLPRRGDPLDPVLYFDYGYRSRAQFVVICATPTGMETSAPMTRTSNLVRHFEMPQSQGEDIVLIREIREFIASRSPFSCASHP